MEEADLKRLLWRCRRGTRELDIILERFVRYVYSGLPNEEKELFDQLLDKQDPILNEWFYQAVIPQDQGMAKIVKRILSTD